MLKNNLYIIIPIIVLCAFYGFGLNGMHNPETADWFIQKTPLNMLVSLTCVLIGHRGWHKNLVIVLIAIGILGWLVEVIGVHTGFPFGIYDYNDSVLGIQFLNVPLILGINWIVTTYSATIVANWVFMLLKINKIPYSNVLIPFFAACLMVGLDILIEPKAILLNFWSWQNDVVPIQNYLGWLVYGFLFQLLLQKTLKITTPQNENRSFNNPIAIFYFILNILFFNFL